MGMVHCVGGCIQLPLQLLYFPFPTPIIEGAIGINRNGNKQKTKAKKGNKKKDQNKFLNKDKKEKFMLVHLFLLCKNLNKNFEAGIEDISKNMLGM